MLTKLLSPSFITQPDRLVVQCGVCGSVSGNAISVSWSFVALQSLKPFRVEDPSVLMKPFSRAQVEIPQKYF